jgi:hypothetical protein
MAGWQIVLAVIVSWFLGDCSGVPMVRALNGSFTGGLEGWEVYPPDHISVVGVDRTLNLAMSSSEKVSVKKTAPLDPETELVKISFKVRYQRGPVPWTPGKRHPMYQLILQDPGTQDDSGYSSGGYLVNPWGNWETHEVVQIYQKPSQRVVRLRPLPTALVVKIIVDKGDGTFQFDDFRVQEFVTRPVIEHR